MSFYEQDHLPPPPPRDGQLSVRASQVVGALILAVTFAIVTVTVLAVVYAPGSRFDSVPLVGRGLDAAQTVRGLAGLG